MNIGERNACVCQSLQCSLVNGGEERKKHTYKTKKNSRVDRVVASSTLCTVSACLIVRADGDSRSLQAAATFRQPGDSVLLRWRQRRLKKLTRSLHDPHENYFLLLLFFFFFFFFFWRQGNTPWTRLTDRDTRSLLLFYCLFSTRV